MNACGPQHEKPSLASPHCLLLACSVLSALLAAAAGYRQGHVTEVCLFLAVEAMVVPLGCAGLAELLRQQEGVKSSLRFSRPASLVAIVFLLGYFGPILRGPPNPDTAAHLALFLYPVIQALLCIAIYVVVTMCEILFLKHK